MMESTDYNAPSKGALRFRVRVQRTLCMLFESVKTPMKGFESLEDPPKANR